MLLPLITALTLATAPPEEEARLVVLVSVDQLFFENLARLEPALEGGLGRFLKRGARFPGARLPYGSTSTGPGHATYATGCLPARHGLTGNVFWNRTTRREEYCVFDPEGRLVTGQGKLEAGAGSRSPRNLLMPSLGEHVRAAYPEAQVVSISGKDRGAITLAGRGADAAVWWYRGALGAGFATCEAYGDELPGWAQRANAAWPAQLSGAVWEPTFDLLDPPPGTAAELRGQEGTLLGSQGRFPYAFPVLSELGPVERTQLAKLAFGSHWVDTLVARAALEAVTEHALGADETPDVLALSFSACDTVGHTFGPYSCEVTDVLLRLDVGLGALFEQLDRDVGAGRWLGVLSSDHGVLPLQGAPAGEPTADLRVRPADKQALREALTTALERRFGERAPRARLNSTGIVVDDRTVAEHGLEIAEVRRVLARAAQQAPWIARAYPLDVLLSDGPTEDPLLAACRASSHPDRSPDVQLVRLPASLEDDDDRGTSHGSPYPYDQRIPLVFLGTPFPAGEYGGTPSSADAVPTLLRALLIEGGPALDGTALEFPR